MFFTEKFLAQGPLGLILPLAKDHGLLKSDDIFPKLNWLISLKVIAIYCYEKNFSVYLLSFWCVC